MCQHGFGNLVAHPHHRIQCGHRLLKDHADSRAADVPHLRFRQREQLFATKLDASANAGLRRQQAQDGQGADRFSRTRFPNQSQHLARTDVKADIAHSGQNSLGGDEFDAKVADV